MARLFAIRCENEAHKVISSKIEADAWDCVSSLAEFLEAGKYASMKSTLFGWKEERAHLAGARETYAWRGLIDAIKASDLTDIASTIERAGKSSPSSLIRSKPIMLRIAGEVTNALLHSYTNRHKITFFQCDLKDPL